MAQTRGRASSRNSKDAAMRASSTQQQQPSAQNPQRNAPIQSNAAAISEKTAATAQEHRKCGCCLSRFFFWTLKRTILVYLLFTTLWTCPQNPKHPVCTVEKKIFSNVIQPATDSFFATPLGSRFYNAYEGHMVPLYKSHGKPLAIKTYRLANQHVVPIVKRVADPVCQEFKRQIDPLSTKLSDHYYTLVHPWISPVATKVVFTFETYVIPVVRSTSAWSCKFTREKAVPAANIAWSNYIVPTYQNHFVPFWNNHLNPAINSAADHTVRYTKAKIVPGLRKGSDFAFEKLSYFTKTYVRPAARKATLVCYRFVNNHVVPPVQRAYSLYLKRHVDAVVDWEKVEIITQTAETALSKSIKWTSEVLVEFYYITYEIITGDLHPTLAAQRAEKKSPFAIPKKTDAHDIYGNIKKQPSKPDLARQAQEIGNKWWGAARQWVQQARNVATNVATNIGQKVEKKLTQPSEVKEKHIGDTHVEETTRSSSDDAVLEQTVAPEESSKSNEIPDLVPEEAVSVIYNAHEEALNKFNNLREAVDDKLNLESFPSIINDVEESVLEATTLLAEMHPKFDQIVDAAMKAVESKYAKMGIRPSDISDDLKEILTGVARSVLDSTEESPKDTTEAENTETMMTYADTLPPSSQSTEDTVETVTPEPIEPVEPEISVEEPVSHGSESGSEPSSKETQEKAPVPEAEPVESDTPTKKAVSKSEPGVIEKLGEVAKDIESVIEDRIEQNKHEHKEHLEQVIEFVHPGSSKSSEDQDTLQDVSSSSSITTTDADSSAKLLATVEEPKVPIVQKPQINSVEKQKISVEDTPSEEAKPTSLVVADKAWESESIVGEPKVAPPSAAKEKESEIVSKSVVETPKNSDSSADASDDTERTSTSIATTETSGLNIDKVVNNEEDPDLSRVAAEWVSYAKKSISEQVAQDRSLSNLRESVSISTESLDKAPVVSDVSVAKDYIPSDSIQKTENGVESIVESEPSLQANIASPTLASASVTSPETSPLEESISKDHKASTLTEDTTVTPDQVANAVKRKVESIVSKVNSEQPPSAPLKQKGSSGSKKKQTGKGGAPKKVKRKKRVSVVKN
ncbi:hypothetical protein H4219_001347 [Mycoemilia scoparia]|uniref:Uncharacterized protein n=1 Tax=Mycoemilia scoparia TaxID=417184 RepID=A0A9W8A8E0_9FUNG|nr:hypothetical protein H4219_001347 [Mycoemilia scoparia]